MSARGIVLVATVLLAGAGAAAAQSRAGLTICNRDERDEAYLVAMIERWPFLFAEQYEASGWYRIEPGACRTWSRGDVNTLFLLSVTQVGAEGRRVLDYGVDSIPDWHWTTDAYGIEEFYCVSDQPFERRADDRAAYTACRGDEYLQLFNLHVFVEHDDHYTLNLQ
jgi:hypothetical protein